MNQFFDAHKELIGSLKTAISRELAFEIDWKHRLIGIKGARSIGKTYFLLQYIKSTFGTDRSCLYVNMNNFYFTYRGLVDFADEFRKTGGKVLVIDQVFKYPNWEQELGEIYDRFPDLKVIFTGSPVMEMEKHPALKGKLKSYSLSGLSFREYLNYQSGNNFSAYSMNDILHYHIEIAKDILLRVKPLAYFNDYLKYGYYPFFTASDNYEQQLIKTANLTLEIDIPILQQVELKYLPKLKKLLYNLSENEPGKPNVSQLSADIETSRATVMNYLNYLRNAKLVHLIYNGEQESSKKPERVYLHNTNLLHAISHSSPSFDAQYETFFFNQIKEKFSISAVGKSGEFKTAEEDVFKIGKHKRFLTKQDKQYVITEMTEVGQDNKIPLWLFGFLY